jgi:hypothetical protein
VFRALPIFLVIFLLVGVLPAQQNADSRVATIAHLAALTESDLNDLLSQAQSGDRELVDYGSLPAFTMHCLVATLPK